MAHWHIPKKPKPQSTKREPLPKTMTVPKIEVEPELCRHCGDGPCMAWYRIVGETVRLCAHTDKPAKQAPTR